MTDEYIEKITTGDRAAFNKLVKTHQDFVLNTCYRFLGNSDDAMDATQDIFIKIYDALHQYKPEAKLSTWIYRIAVNHCLNVLRSKKRAGWLMSVTSLLKSDKKAMEIVVENEANPEMLMQEKEKQQIIQNALSKLNNEQRTAIILHRYQGLSYKEIAHVMQTSVSSVESRIFRAKQQLAAYLKPFISETGSL